jgi:hypothetical protein
MVNATPYKANRWHRCVDADQLYDRVHMADLRDQFGGIDIYLFDQLLRKRITAGMRIVDAGCGFGRNLVSGISFLISKTAP